MSGEAAALIRAWPVGPWTVTLTAPHLRPGAVQAVAMEWLPHMPDRPLTADELQQYRQGRDEAFRSLGLNVLILEA